MRALLVEFQTERAQLQSEVDRIAAAVNSRNGVEGMRCTTPAELPNVLLAIRVLQARILNLDRKIARMRRALKPPAEGDAAKKVGSGK